MQSFRGVPEPVLGHCLWCVIRVGEKDTAPEAPICKCPYGEQVLAQQLTGRVRQVVGDAQIAQMSIFIGALCFLIAARLMRPKRFSPLPARA
jgi:hypothetical protein